MCRFGHRIFDAKAATQTETLKDVWAPPSGVMVSLQLLPVSAAQTSRLIWLWPKETPSPWRVSPVASRPPAWSGGRMVSMRIFKQGQIYSMRPKQPCWHLSGSELKPDQRLRVLSGGRQLQISSAARSDTASYSCTASSASGLTSKEYSLQVYGTLEPPYLWRLTLKFIYLSSSVSKLTCFPHFSSSFHQTQHAGHRRSRRDQRRQCYPPVCSRGHPKASSHMAERWTASFWASSRQDLERGTAAADKKCQGVGHWALHLQCC